VGDTEVLWTGQRAWTNPFRLPDGTHAPLFSRPGLVETVVTLAVIGVICVGGVLLELWSSWVSIGLVIAGPFVVGAIMKRLAKAHERRPVRYRLTADRLTEIRTDWRGRTVERDAPLVRLVPELRQGSSEELGTITFEGTDLAIQDIEGAADVYELIVRTRQP
jgi:hypothetical protein